MVETTAGCKMPARAFALSTNFGRKIVAVLPLFLRPRAYHAKSRAISYNAVARAARLNGNDQKEWP
ncbi:hypothetical protein C7I85_08920 [Mesorhizobium soli]|uniref:Uncharacterized protein n=1 Tax=Pseudaminobacter soli (ex Li et al. 2025) TaxID=1295366 RepID=A0A2P7SFC9_9HYPH|nr:hypothetical protein C7I85_08920 [Mesorhizobium soli]